MNFFWSKQKPVNEHTLIKPTTDDINKYIKMKLYTKVLNELNSYIYPDMNLFFKYNEEYDEVIKQINDMLRPDMNLYELFFNSVLDELEEEYEDIKTHFDQKYNYNTNPYYDQIVLDIKNKYWSFKFNLVLNELEDTVYPIGKHGNKYKPVNKHLNNVFKTNLAAMSYLDLDDKITDEIPSLIPIRPIRPIKPIRPIGPIGPIGPIKKSAIDTDTITADIFNYIIVGYTSNEFCMLGIYSSMDIIKKNKDKLIEYVSNTKMPYIFKIIKIKENEIDCLAFTIYEDKPFLENKGSVIVSAPNSLDFRVYLEFL